jgi:1,2-diacylglycerol 3-beta-galactosyltransferase
VESALTVLLFEVLRETLKRFQPDAIVTTYPLYAPPLAAVFVAQRKAVPLLVVVTDLVNVHRIWFHKSADWCLVPTAAVRAQALKAGLPSPKVRITGIPVNPELSADSRTQAAIRSHLGLQPDRMTVLAVGSRRVRSLMDNLHVLNHSGLPIQIAAVAGGDSDLYAELQETQWHIPVQVYGYVKDMVPLILAADLVLCKAGGLAVTEALAAGRPLLLVDVLPGQEEGNAAHVVEGGAGELSRKPTETLEILCHWLAQGGALLGLRAERSRALGRPQAALEVAEIAWQAAVEGPELRPRGRGPSRARIEKLLRQHGIRWQEGPAESDPRAGA